MLRRLYDRIIGLAAHPRALLWLGVLSVAESSVFPLAPDIPDHPFGAGAPAPGLFALGSAVSRGSRFFLEAALLSRYGGPFRRFIEGHLVLLLPLITFLLLGGFLLFRYL